MDTDQIIYFCKSYRGIVCFYLS